MLNLPLDGLSKWAGLLVILLISLANPSASRGTERIILLDGRQLNGVSESIHHGNVRWRTVTGEVVSIPIDQIVRIDSIITQGPPPNITPNDLPLANSNSISSAAEKTTKLPQVMAARSTIPPSPSSNSSVPSSQATGSIFDSDSTFAADIPSLMETEPTLPEVIDLTLPEEAFNSATSDETWTKSVPLLGPSVDAIGSVFSTAQQTATAATNQASLWTNRIQLGGNFTNGNSNIDIVDVLAQFERSTKVSLRQMDVGGQWAQSTGTVTANRWWLNGNFDWPFSSEEDRWITFFSTKNEYNKLANLNFRGTNTTGLGYRFFFEPKKRFITRIGPAVTVESFDSPDDTRTTFDLFSELEVRWPIAKRTSLESRIRYQPGLLDGAIYRVFSTSSILWDLDEDNRWKLALNLRTEYVSVPSPGRKSTDWFTIVSLVYQRK